MQKAREPARDDEAAARSVRIEQLLARGLAAARLAYDAGSYPEDYGQHNVDRVIVGSPLTLAHALLRCGDVDSVSRAHSIIEEILDQQERHPRHPHRGNWPRFVDDDEIEDLNSAPFVLRWLIPLLAEEQQRIPDALLHRCRAGLRLALEELERLDISPIYTNIHLMALFGLIAGGEWLHDAHFEGIGKERWRRWLAFSIESGAPREYNSATYMGMNLTVLAKLHSITTDKTVRLEARLLYERFWLHAATHIHRATRQLAGPHARCYWTPMISGRERLMEILWRETGWPWLLEPGPYEERGEELPRNLEIALTDFWLPDFAKAWIDRQELAGAHEVRETANRSEGHDLTTYLTPTYALGTASRTYSTGTGVLAIEQMANCLLLHYARPGKRGGWGLMYSRYVVNDQHLGTLGSYPFRPGTNFFDQGNFAGVQLRNKAVCLYALLPQNDTYVHSLKTVVAFQSGDALERIFVDERLVGRDELPCAIAPGAWTIIEDGAVYVALRPLEPSCLGRDAPILLERGPLGELWLTTYNYRGRPKRFWDLASLTGAYWRGNLKAGFVVEVAERTEHPSAAAFLSHLRQASIEDAVRGMVRTVSYRSGGDSLTLAYDLWNSEPKERVLNGASYDPPSLSSPLGVQGDSGELTVGSARLLTRPQPAWLIAQELDPARRGWIAVNPQDAPTPLRLETPAGAITAEELGLGRLEWRSPEGARASLIVDTLRRPVGLKAPSEVDIHYCTSD